MTFNFDSLAEPARDAIARAGAEARHPEHEVRSRRRALLVGQPNVGKSVVFGALTGTYVTVSNYPGTTVEITRGTASFGAEPWEVIDTPGTHNLVPMSEDEAVTRDLLVSEAHDALVQIGDAKNLSRTLLLGLQLAELGIPFCLDLNMLDEARSRGLTIDLRALERELEGVRVNASTAIDGEGLDALRDYFATCAADRSVHGRAPLPCAPRFPEDVEAAISDVEAHLDGALPVAKRAIATMLLGAGDREIAHLPPAAASSSARLVASERSASLARAHGVPTFALLSRLRLVRAQAILRRVQHRDEALGRSQAGTRPSWPAAVAFAAPAALAASLVYDGALARARVSASTDPLASYGFFDIAARALSSKIFSGWSVEGLAFLVTTTAAATVLLRRTARARSGLWKIAGCFTVGWLAYFVTSAFEGIGFGTYTSMPVRAGAIAGFAALVAAVRVGDEKDAALSSAVGRVATHSVWGLGLLAVVLLLAYKIVGVFGAGTAVDFVENRIFGGVAAAVSLDAPSAPSPASPGAADGTRQLVVEPAGPSRVMVTAEVLRSGQFFPDTDARIDVYARGARVEDAGPGRRIVDGPLHGAEARVWTGHVNRWAYSFFAWIGIPLLTAFFVGPYGLVTMGVTYAVAIVLPVVTTFFFVFSMLEDSGYLPRLAVMANRSLRGMGLNGRAVLPMVLGLGCDTMATLTARIMETKKERTLVTLLLALGIPCSSQLSVIFALMQRTSHTATAVWLAVVIGTLLGVGWIAARALPGDRSDFLLEIPPMRRPAVGNLVAKTMARIEWYLKEAVPLFLAGTALLFTLDALHLLGLVHRAGEPIVHHMLGFSRAGGVADRVSEALLVGFLRRDFGAAGLLDLARAGRLSPADVAVSMVTITLFIPCIANVFMIGKERGWKAAAAMSGFIFPYAVAVGAMVRFGFRIFGG